MRVRGALLSTLCDAWCVVGSGAVDDWQSPSKYTLYMTARNTLKLMWTLNQKRVALNFGSLVMVGVVLVATTHETATLRQNDYLTPELRQAVEALKRDVAWTATDERTIASRASLLADWVDAYALAGYEVGLEGPRVRLQATLPSAGPVARRQGAIVDRLVREFSLRDEEGALGKLTAASLGPFEARSYATIRQTWTVGTHGVEPGGGVWVARHFNANFGRFQTDEPTADGYITVSTTDPDARLVVDSIMASGPHGGFRAPQPALTFTVADGRLDPGETVTVTYGDTTGGGAGLLLPSTSSARMPLPLYVDLDGSREWRPLPLQPFVINGTTVAGVHGFAPSVVEPNEIFELSVRAEDRFFNRATGPIPAFEVLVNGAVLATTAADQGAITILNMTLPEEGVYWVTFRSENGTIEGNANPILVTDDPDHRIYWGDTHGHTGYAEGIGSLDFFMRFARDDARLDFVTHSEHDVWLDADEWRQTEDASLRYDEPGRFTPFLGWEWTRHTRFGGHHNVLFRSPGQHQLVSSLDHPVLSDLYQGLREIYDPDEVLVIPHAHNPGNARQSDPLLEPLIEVMSMHGSFEWFMRAYLSNGHQVGFVAASDDHLSHPGYSAPNRNSLAQRGGLGAVLAPEHSRDALFDAMKTRRTYATTGDRLILDVRLNGTGMGQRAEYDRTRRVTGRVIGTAPIASIALYKNDTPIWERDYLTASAVNTSHQELLLSFHSTEAPVNRGDAPRGWRHWRGMLSVEGATLDAVEGTDFFNPTTQGLEQDGNMARFATHTRGDTSSLRLRLSNVSPDAAIVLNLDEAAETGSAPPFYRLHPTIPAADVRLRLAEMAAGRLELAVPAVDYPDDGLTLRHIVTDGERDISFSHTDERAPNQGDYYYVRVRQANDAVAWSSPIWVGGFPSR